MKVAIVGGGWAGLAAAVEAIRLGHVVTLYEMSATLGGRARSVRIGERCFDNGQHILIGAYTRTLASMRTVGVDIDSVLRRSPLQVLYPDGSGLKMESGAPIPAFLRAVAGYRGWGWRARLSLLGAAAGWSLARFRCDPSWTVARLTQRLPAIVRDDFIDPLCVAALNTPASQASAGVFLRVLRDALFSGPGSADLLLPLRGLDKLFPEPAARWLDGHGATLRLGCRVERIDPGADADAGWTVDGEPFGAVILACTATEAARLTAPVAPAWSAVARSLAYEPIVTVWLQAGSARLPTPMLALRSDSRNPAQFMFDHGALSGQAGLMAFVVSGAGSWLERGVHVLAEAVRAQAQATWASMGRPASLGVPLVVQTISEKRATFLCTPGLKRPASLIAPALYAAGDYVDGPYPATLEGAVRSGLGAVELLGRG